MRGAGRAASLAGASAALSLLLAAQSAPQASSPAEATENAGLFRIAGIVVNANSGARLYGVDVTVSVAGTGPGIGQLAAVTTGEDGSFWFEGLKAGKYRVMASRRGFVTAAYDEHEGFFTAIVTGPGLDTTHLQFQILPTAVFGGTVTDDTGDPVPGALVSLFRQNHADGLGNMTRVRVEVTDDLGAFEFNRLDPGNYLVAASGQPWYAFHPQARQQSGAVDGQMRREQPRSPLDVAYPVTFYPDTTDADSATPIPLRAGEHPQLKLVLHAVPALTLRVKLANPGVDANGVPRQAPFPMLTRTVFDTTENAFNGMSVVTNSDQRYAEISGLPPGEYSLRFPGERGQEQASAQVELSGDQVFDATSQASGVDVSAKVAMAFGANLPDRLNVFLRSPGRNMNFGPPGERASDDGTFVVHGVAPGNYELVAISAGRPLGVLRVEGSAKQTEGNRIQVGGEPVSVTVTLADGRATVSGFARRNGQGLGGVMIVLAPRDPVANHDLFRRDQSDSDGSFALRGVVPGRYTVLAIEDGWDLDWAREEVLHKYLAHGVRVDVKQNGGEVDLHDALEVQGR